ncbi:MAG TPA: hypothetical protein VFZ97_18380 [Acidimicrobiales bacterium]
MYFRPVICTIPPASPSAPVIPPPVGSFAELACQSSTPALVPWTTLEQESSASSVVLTYINGYTGGGVRYVVGRADLTTLDVVSAETELAPVPASRTRWC